MRSIWRVLTATLLFFCILTLAIVIQPNLDAFASATSFGATSIPTAQPDVGIHVETIGSAFIPGDAITFTLTISNSGTDVASGIIVTDIVPAQILTSSFSSTLGLTPTGTIAYMWSVEPLDPGEVGVITITGQIDPALPDNFSFTNSAAITDPDDTSPGNNASQVFVGTYQVFLPIVMRNWPPTSDVWIYNETGANITVEIVGVAKQDFAPGTYKWVTIPYGTYIINVWTAQYYYHLTQQINYSPFNIHVGS
jgi:uncharacterized repeat protein (TIGR01451 family)